MTFTNISFRKDAIEDTSGVAQGKALRYHRYHSVDADTATIIRGADYFKPAYELGVIAPNDFIICTTSATVVPNDKNRTSTANATTGSFVLQVLPIAETGTDAGKVLTQFIPSSSVAPA